MVLLLRLLLRCVRRRAGYTVVGGGVLAPRSFRCSSTQHRDDDAPIILQPQQHLQRRCCFAVTANNPDDAHKRTGEAQGTGVEEEVSTRTGGLPDLPPHEEQRAVPTNNSITSSGHCDVGEGGRNEK